MTRLRTLLFAVLALGVCVLLVDVVFNSHTGSPLLQLGFLSDADAALQPLITDYSEAMRRARAALEVDAQRAVCAPAHFVSTLDAEWRRKTRRPDAATMAAFLGRTHSETSFTRFEWPDRVRFDTSVKCVLAVGEAVEAAAAADDGFHVLSLQGVVTREEASTIGWDAWRRLSREQVEAGVRVTGTTWFRCGYRLEVRYGYDLQDEGAAQHRVPGSQTPVVVYTMDSVSRAMFYRAYNKTLALLARQNGHTPRADWTQHSPPKDSVGAFKDEVPGPGGPLYSVFDLRMTHTIGRGTVEQIGPLWTGFHVLRPDKSTTTAKRRSSVAEFGEDGLATRNHPCCISRLMSQRYGHRSISSQHAAGPLDKQCEWDVFIRTQNKAPAITHAWSESHGYKVTASEPHVQYQLAMINDALRGWQEGKTKRPPFMFFQSSEAHSADHRLVHVLDDPEYRWLRGVLEPGQHDSDEFAWTPDMKPPADETRLPIVTLMGDHGLMYGSLARETAAGYVETQHPVMMLMVPNALLRRCPQVYRALRANQDRLVSVFDLRKTLLDLPHVLDANADCGATPSPHQECAPYGTTLAQPLPKDRTCHDAGVPNLMCLCNPWLDVKDEALRQRVGRLVVEHINDQTQAPYQGAQPCARLTFKATTKARVKPVKPMMWVGSKPTVKDSVRTFEVTVTTEAAFGILEEEFEGTVVLDPNDKAEVTFLQRNSRYNIYDHCRPPSHPFRQLCVCKLPWVDRVPGSDEPHKPPQEYELPMWNLE